MAKIVGARLRGMAAALALAGLSGCVPPPLPPPMAPPLVAIPGPGKTEEVFRQDDAICRADAASSPAGSVPGAAATGSTPPASLAPSAPDGTVQAGEPGGAAPDAGAPPPVDTYLRCMAAHNNVVQPVALAHPLPYGYFDADAYGYPGGPFYPGYDPFFVGGYYGFGFYGGCCGYRYGGYRGAYRGGFRGGYRGGGFHGGFARGGRR